MARTNVARRTPPVFTHGGAPANPHLSALEQLRRTVLSCFLFEGTYYEDGEDVADRITRLAALVDVHDLAVLAVEARHEHNLRHVSLLLLVALIARAREWNGEAVEGEWTVAKVIAYVISRPDEITELLSLYWRRGRRPLSAQLKKGLALAFTKFSAYQLAKYNRDDAIKLRDVLFLCHAAPKDDQQAETFKQLVDGTLPSPDTWEVALSGGADKRETFERMITDGKLGYMALLRNLRNMDQAGADTKLVNDAIRARKGGAEKLLPFRFVAAARAAPRFEKALDDALIANIEQMPQLKGRTIVLVDVSGSMTDRLSGKSDMDRATAAATLASVINAEELRVFSFSNHVVEVPARRGMAGVDAIIRSQGHGGTNLAEAVAAINKLPHDRLIVITDEQATSFGRVPAPAAPRGYMINVASYQNGVNFGDWVQINGFSEAVLKWLHIYEEQK